MLYALCAALSLALLGLDQWVKHYVTVNIPLGEAQPFLPGLVELRTVHNYGAAWSSFSGMRWLLVAVASVIVIAVAVVLLRRIVRHPLGVAAGFLILSGGVGNIIDRVRLGYVVDMFHLEFWPSYPVFNVADICVVWRRAGGNLLPMVLREIRQRGKAHGDADAPVNPEGHRHPAGRLAGRAAAGRDPLRRRPGCARRGGSPLPESPWRKTTA